MTFSIRKPSFVSIAFLPTLKTYTTERKPKQGRTSLSTLCKENQDVCTTMRVGVGGRERLESTATSVQTTSEGYHFVKGGNI